MTSNAEAPNTDTSISQSLAAVSAKLTKSDPCKARIAAQATANTKSGKVSASPKSKRKTKAAAVEKLLKRKSGATIDQICRSTGWQAHTCRAFLTGLRKKGREVVRETAANGKSVYRITSPSTGEEAC